jgi:hypothetical protein
VQKLGLVERAEKLTQFRTTIEPTSKKREVSSNLTDSELEAIENDPNQSSFV